MSREHDTISITLPSFKEIIRMQVNDGASPHEVSQRWAPAGSPWREGSTTWGAPHPRHLKGGLMLAGQASRDHLSQPRGVLI